MSLDPLKEIPEDECEPTEEQFHTYCRSIGISNTHSEVLSEFLYKTYECIPEGSGQQKLGIYSILSSFMNLPDNQWGTTRVSELKGILDTKEKELNDLHNEKMALDKRALRRANLMLYLGGTVLIGQFAFIV